MAASTPLQPPARLWRLASWRISHLATRSSRLVLDHIGSAQDRTDYAVLAALEEAGPLSQAELGRFVGLDRSDVVAVVGALEHRALVLRGPDPEDRRRNVVRITTAGRRRRHRLDRAVDAAQADLLAPLGARERDQLERLLGRLLEHHTAFRAPGPR